MTSLFAAYLQLGARHIADLAGYDHILFVAALTVAFPPAQWRRLLLLVTAFTLGHSITLALATLRLVTVDTGWVEFLIPVTIAVTAGATLASLRSGIDWTPDARGRFAARYLAGAGFGLIHGLGFSNFLRAALGAEESLGVPLFAFNVGLEMGQLAIVACVLLIGVLATDAARISRVRWVGAASVGILLVALKLAAERWPA